MLFTFCLRSSQDRDQSRLASQWVPVGTNRDRCFYINEVGAVGSSCDGCQVWRYTTLLGTTRLQTLGAYQSRSLHPFVEFCGDCARQTWTSDEDPWIPENYNLFTNHKSTLRLARESRKSKFLIGNFQERTMGSKRPVIFVKRQSSYGIV